jgi:hypothetical protein
MFQGTSVTSPSMGVLWPARTRVGIRTLSLYGSGSSQELSIVGLPHIFQNYITVLATLLVIIYLSNSIDQ